MLKILRHTINIEYFNVKLVYVILFLRKCMVPALFEKITKYLYLRGCFRGKHVVLYNKPKAAVHPGLLC
jgi:hypothetical protein